jgi:hypothetical protein
LSNYYNYYTLEVQVADFSGYLTCNSAGSLSCSTESKSDGSQYWAPVGDMIWPNFGLLNQLYQMLVLYKGGNQVADTCAFTAVNLLSNLDGSPGFSTQFRFVAQGNYNPQVAIQMQADQRQNLYIDNNNNNAVSFGNWHDTAWQKWIVTVVS